MHIYYINNEHPLNPAGEDTRLFDSDHKTAHELAKLANHFEILEFLKEIPDPLKKRSCPPLSKPASRTNCE